MSKKKEYTLTIKADVQTDPVKELSKNLRDVHLVLSMVILPLRLYHLGLRMAHLFQGALNTDTADSVGPLNAQAGAFGTVSESLDLANQQLAEYVMLMAAATEGASVPGAAGGAAAAGTLVGGITAASVVGAQTSPGTAATVAMTGAAIVHEGESIGRPGGGFGGGTVNVNIANVSMNPAGMDISDVASQLGAELQLALRGLTRNIPT